MTFKIPYKKNLDFSKGLFEMFSDQLMELKSQYGKLPNRITLYGPLGKELFDFIVDAEWDMEVFGLSCSTSIVNKMRFDYTKPLSKIEDVGGTIFDKSLSDIQVTGIPSKETMSKIVSKYSAPAYTIEREVRPFLEIRLTR